MPSRRCLGLCGRLISAERERCDQCARDRAAADPYLDPAWQRLAKTVTRRDGECLVCGSTSRLTAHHIRPRTAGGADSEENLMTLCGSCHSSYEADVRAGRRSDLRVLVESVGVALARVL